MKTIICNNPGQIGLTQTEKPALQAGHSILKIQQVGICGTDIHAYEGTQPYFNYPRILGHELGAEIEETTDPKLAKGDRVTVIPYQHCGTCIACRRGKTNCCVNMQVMGVHIDGGMRSFFSVPNHLIIKENELSPEELALVEPLSIGAHGVRNAQIQEGDFALVIGAGPIGLGTMEMARIAGAQVIAMDVNADRLRFCKETLGIQHIIQVNAEDPQEKLKEITQGEMPIVVFDCTGNLKSINKGFEYLAHSGKYILIGLQKGDISFSHPEFHKREITLMSSRNATLADFQHVIESMKQKKIDPQKYITHRFPAAEIQATFDTCLNPASGVIKAQISF